MAETNYAPDPRAKPLVFTASREYGSFNLTGGGSGGGTQEVFQAAAAPSAPTDPTKPAIYYPTGGGVMLQWDVASQAWV